MPWRWRRGWPSTAAQHGVLLEQIRELHTELERLREFHPCMRVSLMLEGSTMQLHLHNVSECEESPDGPGILRYRLHGRDEWDEIVGVVRFSALVEERTGA